MAKYPISHNGSKKLGAYFKEILTFHIPPSNEKKILDPTCGLKHLWEDYPNVVEDYGEVVFSDIKDSGQGIVSDINDLEFESKFDGIVYDPPYFFGYNGSKDPRKIDYGDYVQSLDKLVEFMEIANSKLYDLLKDDGKLFVKCADQYQTKERKFYAHHHTWICRLTKFQLVDIFIFTHHRMSPTAFQVKNRPCAVIMHTYFLVFMKRTA